MPSRRFSKSILFSICAIAVAWTLPAVAWAGNVKDTLSLIPEDAWGFLIAKSINGVDATAAKVKDSLGLPFPTPLTPMALEPLNLGDEIDKDSPICVIMMDMNKFGGAENAAVILAPAKDPKAMLEKLAGEPAQDGISKCTVMGEPAFAAIRGKTVILGPNQDCVTKVAKTNKSMADGFSEARLKAAGKSDLYIDLSVKGIWGAYKDTAMGFLQMAMSAQDPEGKNAKQFEKILGELNSLDIAINYDDAGLSIVAFAVPQGGSDLEKMITTDEKIGDKALAVLPLEKFILTMSGSATQSDLSKEFGGGNSVSALLKAMSIPNVNEEAAKTLDADLADLNKLLKAYALSLSALTEGSEGMFGATIVAETKDAKEFVGQMRKVYASMQKLSDDEDFGTIKKNIVHKADAETIEGNKVDTLVINVEDLAEATEGDADDVKKAQTLFGKEPTIRFGPAGDKHVIIAFGGGKKRYESICRATKSSGDPLSSDPGIKTLSASLPSPRVMEGFFAVDNLFQTIKSVSKAVGEEDEMPFELQTINAPVAFSSAVQDKSSRFDIVVPMKLIKSLKEVYDKYAASSKDDDFDADDDAKGDGAKDADDADADDDKPSDKSGDDSAADDKDGAKDSDNADKDAGDKKPDDNGDDSGKDDDDK